MEVISPQQLDHEDCSVENCEREGRRRYHSPGRAVLCEHHYQEHRERRRLERERRPVKPKKAISSSTNGSANGRANGLLARRALALVEIAERVDQARAAAEPAIRELQKAQQAWDEALAALAQGPHS